MAAVSFNVGDAVWLADKEAGYVPGVLQEDRGNGWVRGFNGVMYDDNIMIKDNFKDEFIPCAVVI
jgi:hypothetical protein